jgi:hypothetical protein
MEIFNLYFNLGISHILDFNGYDHILFLTALISVYLITQWRKIIVLVTAFTLGHATTLVLSTLNIIYVNPMLVEFLIPITIILTSISNIITKTSSEINKKLYYLKYLISVIFGLIHGLGFSSYLKSMLSESDNMINPLLAFNLGIELGQFIVVSIILVISYIFISKLKVEQREWNLFISGAAFGVSLILALERIPFG